MSITAMKQALEALERAVSTCFDRRAHEDVMSRPEHFINQTITTLRTAIAEAEKQEPVALETVYETIIHWDEGGGKRSRRELARRIVAIYTTPPAAQRQPLIDSVRQMRDVQGMDGTWNCDPYMHGLYNGLEFAVSLLEQREPQFKDAPEKWLSDLPKPRIFSATEAAHGIKEKNT